MAYGQLRGKPYLENDVFGLMWGSVVGDSHFLTARTKENFSFLGIQHMTAASGYNVQLLTTLMSAILPNQRKTLSVCLTCLGVFIYVGICNFQPSIVRAAVQWSISSWLNYLQRPFSGYWSLGLSVLLLCIIKPEYLTLIGFQLSVGATLGILLFAKINGKETQRISLSIIKQTDLLTAKKMQRSLRLDQRAITICARYAHETSRISLAASVFTIPIIYYQFGQLSVWFLLGNITVQWLMPWITFSSLIYFGTSIASIQASYYLKPYLVIPSSTALILISIAAKAGREVEKSLSFFK